MLAALAPALAAAAPPPVEVTDGRMQVLIPSRPAAGYFTLRNTGGAPLSLVGASAPDCGSLMLHRSDTAGGTASMRMVEAVPLAPGESVRFAPGGYHLMCLDPSGRLLGRTGVERVTLRFGDGGSVEAPFAIEGVRR